MTSTKTALVTGGTDGIGRATALELARHGFTLHVLGRSSARGERTLAELRGIGPDRPHELFLVDLADLEAVDGFLQRYAGRRDTLDLLVLNANAWIPQLSVSSAGADVVFTVGYLSRYRLSRLRVPSCAECLFESGKGYVLGLDFPGA